MHVRNKELKQGSKHDGGGCAEVKGLKLDLKTV